MTTFGLAAPVVLLLCLAILPDVILLISALALMPHYLKTHPRSLGRHLHHLCRLLKAEPTRQSRAGCTGRPLRPAIQSETTLPPDPKPKEAP